MRSTRHTKKATIINAADRVTSPSEKGYHHHPSTRVVAVHPLEPVPHHLTNSIAFVFGTSYNATTLSFRLKLPRQKVKSYFPYSPFPPSPPRTPNGPRSRNDDHQIH